MAYDTGQARQELLDSVAVAADHLGTALAALGAAYEQLDEATADRLEEQLFRPVQHAYGRAMRTYTGFAERYDLRMRPITQAVAPTLVSRGVKGLLENAVDAVGMADAELVALQDSMRPVEVGDAELRAGLAEVRDLAGGLRGKARDFVRILGR
jgi:hypothetical protein